MLCHTSLEVQKKNLQQDLLIREKLEISTKNSNRPRTQRPSTRYQIKCVGSASSKVEIVAKALDGQQYLLPLCEFMWVYDGERGSGPEGADDLCLVSYEALGLYLSINNGI